MLIKEEKTVVKSTGVSIPVARFSWRWDVLQIDGQATGGTSEAASKFLLVVIDKAGKFLLAYYPLPIKELIPCRFGKEVTGAVPHVRGIGVDLQRPGDGVNNRGCEPSLTLGLDVHRPQTNGTPQCTGGGREDGKVAVQGTREGVPKTRPRGWDEFAQPTLHDARRAPTKTPNSDLPTLRP